KPSNSGKKILFCTVKPELREMFISNQLLFVKWLSIKWEDTLVVQHCRKCLQFGHKTLNCKNQPNCSNCHQQTMTNEHHVCKNNQSDKCINCTHSNKNSNTN